MGKVQNICFFNTTSFWGGGEKWHFEAAVRMSKTEHHVFFVCDGGGALSKQMADQDIKQLHLTVGNLTILNSSKIMKLVKFYQEHQIDTVVFNSPKDLKVGGRAAKKAGVQNIVYRRGIAVEVKKSRLNRHLFGDVVTHFIFNSNATKELLQKHYQEIVASKKTAVIYNAISFPEELAKSNQNTGETIVIGNAGRLVEQKAQHYLVDIAQKLKAKKLDFKILIAGDGPLYNDLKKRIEENNLSDKIAMLGFVDDMSSFMNRIDIFVSTAIWEGFGFVLAEAMAAKKPTLAFDMSSNPELVIAGKNGYLIPPKDTTFFASRLEELITNASLRKSMGKNAYEFAKANFEAEKQFQKLLDFIS